MELLTESHGEHSAFLAEKLQQKGGHRLDGLTELLGIAAVEESLTYLVQLEGKDVCKVYGFEDSIYGCAPCNEALGPQVQVLGEG